ncbi:MAG: TIGR01777 family oxidoreductase [Cyclobacteriaceae bacterium]
MSKKILITGASGLIGSRLTELLLQKGYQVSHLGRSKKSGPIPSFIWDVDNEVIDREALEGVLTIIHLAGAGVADKRWTESRKKEILDSRTKSSTLLYKTLASAKHSVKSVISASAIGYYGFGFGEEVFTEDSQPGKDYLAQVTKQWEESVDKITSLNLRIVKLRIGIVLSDKGGALVEMAKPVRLGGGAALGTGKQYLSWIHLDDLCAMFIKAVEDDAMQGAYNAVSGEWVTNEKLTQLIAKVLKKPLLLPNVPGFIMKIIIGEMAVIVVNGSKISADKIKDIGFKFNHTSLEEVLRSLLVESKK